MEIQFDRKKLLEAVKMASAACAKGFTSNDTLKCLKFENRSILAGNYEITARVSMDCQPIETPFLADPGRLSSILSSMVDESVVLKASENSVEVIGRRSKLKLMGPDARDYPDVDLSHSTPVKVSAADLHLGIDKVSHAIDVKETRYALGGIHFHTSGNDLTVETVDGRRAARYSMHCEGSETFSGVVPIESIRLVRQLIASYSGDVEVSIENGRAVITCGDSVVKTRLVDGRFPDVSRVIPDISQMEMVTVGKEELSIAFRQALIFSDRESMGATITLDPAHGSIEIKKTIAEHGSSDASIDGLDISTGAEFCLNTKFVLDVLKVMSGDSVEIYYTEAKGPVRFGGDTAIHVIMPMAAGD